MNYSPGENFGPGEEVPPLPPEYLVRRPRRTRSHPALRRLVRENTLTRDDLILPLFVVEGSNVYQEVSSMQGVYRESLDRLAETAKRAEQLGVPALILFGVPPRDQKDAEGRISWAPDGIVQRALEVVERSAPSLLRIVDLCFCEYTDHGHCGVLTPDGHLDNDATLPNLELQAISLADAGAQVIAPSGMLDGGVAAIRNALDEVGHAEVSILAYAVKYASGFYGPFRDAADSAPAFGDRSTYQMDPANAEEALREARMDIEQGADILMVKPALPYLDILQRLKRTFDVPLAAYQVSGEYAMIKAAGQKGWIDEERVMLESLLSIKRAGANMILTYYAREVAKLLR
ncbi:MAG: porphobilinogen synthase [Planctomycetes bacterium]|nr:porphobilinogen synthase [Planctomycetota bacterium]